MRGELHAIDYYEDTAQCAGYVFGISPRTMEGLWVRLKAGDRIRPRDAQLLKRLSVQPFVDCGVYEVDACGYVIAVGLPGDNKQLDGGLLLSEFESAYGVPATFSGPLGSERCKIYGT